jgi:hypothetical protein
MRSARQRSAEAPGRGPEASARAVRERLVGLIGTGSRIFTEHSSRLSGLVKNAEPLQTWHRFGGASRTTGPADRRTATRPIGSPGVRRELRPTSIATLVEKPQGSETITRALPLGHKGPEDPARGARRQVRTPPRSNGSTDAHPPAESAIRPSVCRSLRDCRGRRAPRSATVQVFA